MIGSFNITAIINGGNSFFGSVDIRIFQLYSNHTGHKIKFIVIFTVKEKKLTDRILMLCFKKFRTCVIIENGSLNERVNKTNNKTKQVDVSQYLATIEL